MVYVGLDISLNSTACVIRRGFKLSCIAFCSRKAITNKIVEESSYQESGGPIIYEYVEWTPLIMKGRGKASNSEVEYTHALDYERLTTEIVMKLLDYIHPDEEVSFNIEGYSQGLNPGKIIEIVSFSSMLRVKIIKTFTKVDVHSFKVIPPSTLKKWVCGATYGYDAKGKVTRAPWGIAGGSFKKPDMFKALLDYDTKRGYTDELVEWLRQHPEYLDRAYIPKPVDDIIDAYWLSEWRDS